MNKKGQALIEFILIFPVIILFVIAVFDFINIEQTKITLENELETYILNEEHKFEKGVSLQIEDDTYYLSKKIDIYSPVLSAVIKTPYKVEIKRSLK